ncbi:methyltransferase-like protein 27 isoform X5 [Cuculus canorus]|uniref:methyltransferase-like protein 27 isoform X5 n=1 Tax=Cuculus canorus TaxID=55661 RepID=UPI0023AB08D9|nr:methyltransferase-like protein 27 isoform X5 [Cuculus canorus]
MWGRAETGSGSGSGVVAMLPAAVRERVAAVHGAAALPELLRLYDGWAARYEQDVAALQYRAPVLAAAALAAALPGPPGAARVLDVCCGTGLVARELRRRGFGLPDGVDGSAEMLARARGAGLYRELRRCVLGSEPLPAPAGGILCLTTRSNPSNLRYKAELEATLERLESQGAWEKVLAQEEDRWERATSEEESTQGTGYISGVVYIYRKCPVPWLPES